MNYDVTTLGAIADGSAPCTEALQAALDQAAETGGTVTIPAGRYRTGSLFVRSSTTLVLERGAVLVASPDIADYPATSERDGDRHRFHFLMLDHVDNVTIRGGGTIDGSGPAFWNDPVPPSPWYRPKAQRPSPMIECVGCTNLSLQEFTLTNSPGWTLHVRDCARVDIHGIQIRNYMYGPNTDGIDITGSHDVHISDCHIETGDDAIVLKTTRGSRTIERVTVTNCTLRTHCVGLKLGCNESFHDMRQVTFSNCVVYKSSRAVGLYTVEGATLEDIAVSNIVCDTYSDLELNDGGELAPDEVSTVNGYVLNRPIHIDLRRRYDTSKMGRIRNVMISNVIARTDGRILLTAEDGAMLENIILRDIHMGYGKVEDPRFTAPHAVSSQFSNRSPEARGARGAVVAENVRNLVLNSLTIDWPPTEGDVPFPAVWGRNLEGGLIDAPLATASQPDVATFDIAGSTIKIREG